MGKDTNIQPTAVQKMPSALPGHFCLSTNLTIHVYSFPVVLRERVVAMIIVYPFFCPVKLGLGKKIVSNGERVVLVS